MCIDPFFQCLQLSLFHFIDLHSVHTGVHDVSVYSYIQCLRSSTKQASSCYSLASLSSTLQTCAERGTCGSDEVCVVCIVNTTISLKKNHNFQEQARGDSGVGKKTSLKQQAEEILRGSRLHVWCSG